MAPPGKRTKLLSDDSDSEDGNSGRQNGVQVPESNGFKINEDYAKRFEYNKKREDRQRLEEKYGADSRKRGREMDDEEDEEDDSTSEEEDDDAELATAELDEEIFDTLRAIKSKDPRVYDPKIKFYKDWENEEGEASATAKKEKPMYLKDYHRENLLAGKAVVDEDEDAPVQTYQQAQDQLRRELVSSMHAGAEKGDDDGDDFMVKKSKQKHDSLPTASKTNPVKISDADVASADKDPETYLSNFMAARAWLPTDGSRFQAMDSDDSEDDDRADKFEEAYNLRFEDPNKANETLQSFARDVAKYSVRRDEKSSRKQAREREREKKEAEKRERQEDKARLRKLKIEEAEEKIKKIKETAGLKGKDFDLQEWRDVIEGDFNDEDWDKEMQRRFGESYYAEADGGNVDSDVDMADDNSNKRKVKKPKWDDDIDIKDILPEFQEDGPEVALSSGDEADGGAPLPVTGDDEDDDAGESTKKKKIGKVEREKAAREAKRAARKERMQVEEMVDNALITEPSGTSSGRPTGFRYRETSPISFGLTARDILFADDSQLNSFVGLKKMAAWREEEKKRRDRKKFSKKARLREWRKETFGDVDGPKFEQPTEAVTEGNAGGEAEGEATKKKKRRSKKAKVAAA
ncbi:protein kri1-like protein [Acrodontium crateriforme]|uniref:Protein kri1-like protein n=1 Tax=Acrodontium crateriforme TaxID=150365 RepID=A0AAQ3M0C1_9PEZI|nr:protein kri1-like protein [Acrodontium crateriforme]